MTQEDKDLLLKDLCTRLPYGILCTDSRHGDSRITEIDTASGLVYFEGVDEYVEIKNIKPYLRPMSSMTEEECDKVEEIIGNDCIFDFMSNGDIVLHNGHFTQKALSALHDFYNSIHVDYHTDDEGKTMIEKGLALEAPKGMY